MRVPRGRYAPSPTGELHVGNASTALLAWLSVRARAGVFILRMEDLDRGRSRPELGRGILEDLAWLGIDWDEGPDRGGPHAPYDQGSRAASHRAAFDALRDAGLVYPCFCSRRDIAGAASAPQTPGDEVRYPGTCAALDREEALRRVGNGERHAWRFRVEAGSAPAFRRSARSASPSRKPPPMRASPGIWSGVSRVGPSIERDGWGAPRCFECEPKVRRGDPQIVFHHPEVRDAARRIRDGCR